MFVIKPCATGIEPTLTHFSCLSTTFCLSTLCMFAGCWSALRMGSSLPIWTSTVPSGCCASVVHSWCSRSLNTGSATLRFCLAFAACSTSFKLREPKSQRFVQRFTQSHLQTYAAVAQPRPTSVDITRSRASGHQLFRNRHMIFNRCLFIYHAAIH
jgi:hypothetical protein